MSFDRVRCGRPAPTTTIRVWIWKDCRLKRFFGDANEVGGRVFFACFREGEKLWVFLKDLD